MDSSSPRSPLDDGEIADDDSKEFDDGYDENLMGDDEDKRKLAQMTEKEREQELFNRSERRETLKIRFEIERKLRAKSKKRELEKKQSKQGRTKKRLRASEIYSSDESSDDSDEYIPDADKSGALMDLASAGSKSSKMHTRASSTIISDSSSESASSSSSSSASESEAERDELNDDDDSQLGQDDYQMPLSDLKCLQLKRDRIEQWVYSPFFKETAIGLFVKISVGNHPKTQQHMYKIAQIMDITKGSRIYAINASKNKTDKYCLVRVGNVERTFAMHFVSNRPFDEDDYNKWLNDLNAEGLSLPSREHFLRKKRDLYRALNYHYTDEDINYEVNEKKRFQGSSCNFAMKKTELIRAKAEAEDMNDYEKAREIQQALDDLEEQAKQLEKSRSSSTFSAISFVNERNRIKNIEESERVLKESKSVKTEDPFTRRKCTPTIVHNKNSNPNSTFPGDQVGINDKNDHQLNNKTDSISTNNNGSLKTIPEVVESVNDLFQAHASIDLELDIDI
uniref:RNA polymerase-associated protein RTF1 n=1 Tax=Aceria tosichella TaxID=561515 RepID=A0A6G1SIF1_9ACAR